jgi:hypothetical protein
MHYVAFGVDTLFDINTATTAKPWGPKEEALWGDMIKTVLGDAIDKTKDTTNGHRHSKLYDVATKSVYLYMGSGGVEISSGINIPAGSTYSIDGIDILTTIGHSVPSGYLLKSGGSHTTTSSHIREWVDGSVQKIEAEAGYTLNESTFTMGTYVLISTVGGGASVTMHTQGNGAGIFLNTTGSGSGISLNTGIGGSITLTAGTSANITLGVTTSTNHVQVNAEIYTDQFQQYSSTTITGFSSLEQQQICYKKLGRTVHVWFNLNGTSNATSTSFTVPYSADDDIEYYFGDAYGVINNGFALTNPGCCRIQSGSSTLVEIFTSSAQGSWTASNQKAVCGYLCYQSNS